MKRDAYLKRVWGWALKEAPYNIILCHYYKIYGNNYITKTVLMITYARNKYR